MKQRTGLCLVLANAVLKNLLDASVQYENSQAIFLFDVTPAAF